MLIDVPDKTFPKRQLYIELNITNGLTIAYKFPQCGSNDTKTVLIAILYAHGQVRLNN